MLPAWYSCNTLIADSDFAEISRMIVVTPCTVAGECRDRISRLKGLHYFISEKEINGLGSAPARPGLQLDFVRDPLMNSVVLAIDIQKLSSVIVTSKRYLGECSPDFAISKVR